VNFPLKGTILFPLLGVLFLPPLFALPPRISVDMAKSLYDGGVAVFVDVRGKHSYLQEHISRAIWFPVAELRKGNLPPVPKTTLLVVYCACPHSLADEAYELLTEKGFSQVYVLEEGYFGWKEKGYPIKVGGTLPYTPFPISGVVEGGKGGETIRVIHLPSGEEEVGTLTKGGRFTLTLHLYGAKEGEELEIQYKKERWRVPLQKDGRWIFTPGEKKGREVSGESGR